MTVLLFFVFSYILLSVSLYFLFPKAGIDGWKGLVPGLNFVEMCKMIGRPSWWALLLLIPIVGFFIYAGLTIDTIRSFGRGRFWESVVAVALAPVIMFMIAFNEENEFEGPIVTKEKEYQNSLIQAKKEGNNVEFERLVRNNPFKQSGGREWVESIVFAVFAAAFIRMFLIEAYVIPTPSMEGNMLVGDFLFVSKAHYGIRTPMTVAMFPLLHNTIPFLKSESYLKSPSLPYFRLKAIETIDNNDPIVFNWPVGDSVYLTSQRSWTVEQVRNEPFIKSQDRELIALEKNKDFRVRPIDKKDHYIKRCIGIAGDSLEIKDRVVYINGKPLDEPSKIQFSYKVEFPQSFDFNKLKDLGLFAGDIAQPRPRMAINLNQEQIDKLKAMDANISIEVLNKRQTGIGMFPNDPKNFNTWSLDNYGPIWIPKAGETVTITPKNIALYRRIIDVYENNDLEIRNGRVFINGKQSTNYTFAQDYYWAMGDNRHNSEDSRAWGFVPHDHIVGKPLFIWMSAKDGNPLKGIRFNRIFKSASTL